MRIHTAHWRIPSEARAFDGWMEGQPTPAQRASVLAKVRAERARWTPSPQAYELLRELRSFIGKRVTIQFWDPIMFMLDDEGPFPLQAYCKDIATLTEGGFEQAYLLLADIVEQPNSSGDSPARFLTPCATTGLVRAPISELYEIDAVGA